MHSGCAQVVQEPIQLEFPASCPSPLKRDHQHCSRIDSPGTQLPGVVSPREQNSQGCTLMQNPPRTANGGAQGRGLNSKIMQGPLGSSTALYSLQCQCKALPAQVEFLQGLWTKAQPHLAAGRGKHTPGGCCLPQEQQQLLEALV